MSLLFQVEKKRVMANTETLLIPPFKQIWERDESNDKSDALEDFAFIEFMVSVRRTNPYSGYPKDKRREKIKEDIITRENWEEDELIKEGMKALDRMQREGSPTYNYYKSALLGAQKLQDFFEDFDLINDINPKNGNPLYKPRDITSALNDTAKILQNLEQLREKVDNEIYDTTKTKGGRKTSMLANPDTL